MRVLVACEFSGYVRDAFIARGHDAISCDLLPTEQPGPHYQGDVRDILNGEKWDMIIAHPPCRYLAKSGIMWLYAKKTKKINAERLNEMKKAAEFFKFFLNSSCKKICVENPVLSKRALDFIGEKYSQIIEPFWFGHLEQKKTCLWLKGLPPLMATKNVKHTTMSLPIQERQPKKFMSFNGDYEERRKERSRFFTGIARAMAEQWG